MQCILQIYLYVKALIYQRFRSNDKFLIDKDEFCSYIVFVNSTNGSFLEPKDFKEGGQAIDWGIGSCTWGSW